MKKVQKHFGIVAIATTLGLALAANTASAETVLKFASFVPDKYILHKPIFLKLGEDLSKATNGEVKIKVYPSGELGKGPVQQYLRAVKRIAEISYGLPGYTSPIFPKTLLVEMPGLAKDHADATAKMWKIMDKHLRGEFKKTRPLALFVTPPAVFMMRTKPIRTAADLKGMKIRVSSKSAATIIQAYGATPVPMPATKVYTAMSTGVVDGALMGSDSLLIFKLIEPAKYVTTNLPHMPTVLFMVMNEQAYQELKPNARKAMDKLTGEELSQRSAAINKKFGDLALKKFAALPGKQIIALDAKARKEFDALAAKGTAVFVKGLEAKGIPASKIIADMKK